MGNTKQQVGKRAQAVDANEEALVPQTPIHPIAKSVAGVLSPMSYRDQQMCFTWCQRILYATGVVLYPVSWWLESFRVFAYGVLGAAALCCLLFVPNWYQRADPEVQYVARKDTKAFYARLREAQTSIAGDE